MCGTGALQMAKIEVDCAVSGTEVGHRLRTTGVEAAAPPTVVP
jgi:hypothetical protein